MISTHTKYYNFHIGDVEIQYHYHNIPQERCRITLGPAKFEKITNKIEIVVVVVVVVYMLDQVIVSFTETSLATKHKRQEKLLSHTLFVWIHI